jgi:SAM-dependent methyltransferase
MTELHDDRSHRNDPEMVEVLHRENLDRYRFAQGHVAGKKVLEVGCAFGHGTALLLERAAEVDAIDLYRPALDYARGHVRDPRARFHEMDACALTFPPESFDAVVSFEVIEHVEDPAAFLAGIRRVLRPGGVVVLSTPNGDLTMVDGKPADPTHLREYRADEFRRLLAGAGFADATVLGQTLGAGVWQVYNLTARASRADVFRLRRLLPGRWKRQILRLLVWLKFRKPAAAVATTAIGPDTAAAHVLVAVCRK